MVIQGSSGMIPSAGIARPYSAGQTPAAPAKSGRESFARRFDSVTISSRSGGQSFAGTVKSALSQELRASAGTETIEALREQIRSGAYRPDPKETARRMLLRA